MKILFKKPTELRCNIFQIELRIYSVNVSICASYRRHSLKKAKTCSDSLIMCIDIVIIRFPFHYRCQLLDSSILPDTYGVLGNTEILFYIGNVCLRIINVIFQDDLINRRKFGCCGFIAPTL